MTHYLYSKHEPEQLEFILTQLKSNDTLEVTRLIDLDLGINEILLLCNRALDEGWKLVCHESFFNTTDELMRAHLSLLGRLLEVDRQRQRKKGLEAIEMAKAMGKSIGRPPKLDQVSQKEAVRMVRQKGWSISDVARAFNVHPSTISRLVSRVV